MSDPVSDDGGFDEFDEFRPNKRSNSATLPNTNTSWASNTATRSPNKAFSASNSAMRAYGSTHPFYNHARGQWWTRALRANTDLTGYLTILATLLSQQVGKFDEQHRGIPVSAVRGSN